MHKPILRITSLAVFASFAISGETLSARAQQPATLYPAMAPLDQYLIADKASEIALARSAAPNSISAGAEVLVLGRHGYETAVKGTNGFVCMVMRSWTDLIDDPDFWNPKQRAPICLNAAAARTYLPFNIMKTNLVLAGKSKPQMFDAIKLALDKGELKPIEPGAMSYMMSKQQYLNDSAKSWYPHVMIFASHTSAKDWGADATDSPIFEADDTSDRLVIFMFPVGKWSDGSNAPPMH